ncbi:MULTISPECIES: helix-turn-helix transcriptional regulator [unclassified Streptococcus]|uniref:helix-turn-helix transcriptional regulator n=1 Tax=unclassified Streptococcus TaxID=2608887 RepID=UPI00211AA600|nr:MULTISPECIES: helix-turn-helix transcriptional regulator [unclassified Streptococcus]MCQ9212254.1 helix-turn-helix transcriptional regulator [Streptococcus sp. B01]MCQ9213585.1 helix-turn-helix transcriptional regulator [Streptococcus sp. O1]
MQKTAFEKLIDDSGIKKRVIAQKMGLTRSGFYQKRKNPKKKFDGNEMVELANILGIEPKKVLETILIS